jgi:hypothetical protein
MKKKSAGVAIAYVEHLFMNMRKLQAKRLI